MPCAHEQRGRDRGGHMGAGAGAVGDVDGIGEPAQRLGLAEEVLRVERDRRGDLGGDDEAPRPQRLFQARDSGARRGSGGHVGVRSEG